MKNALSVLLFFALLGCLHSTGLAAELLDVKPVVSEHGVSIEVSADIAMTYTYYKIPGQARAVVDIAEADPEKVEPLIVVNKGIVSSISVDKAQISGIIISRLIFNLVSETDIFVTAASDRKRLTVTFGGAPAPAAKPEPVLPAVVQPEPVAKAVELPATPPASATPEDDPLGLDEPAAKTVATAVIGAAAGGAAVAVIPVITRVPKLEPVVPVTTVAIARPAALTIKEITTGASFIEIRTNQPVIDYKATRISGPDRLVIDIAGEKIGQKAKTVAINKFGISKARIGVSPKNIRIVIDSGKADFPNHTITNGDNGLKINFK
jgi:type IV pilus assembly protein PilQ